MPPGTAVGDQKFDEFVHDLHAICGDVRLLWLPKDSETTTSTDRSLNARVITYDASVATRYIVQGSGLTVSFNGTANEADPPDVPALSFGNGAQDEPFSLVVLCKPDVTNVAQTLIAKEDSATAEEWNLGLDANADLVLTLTDESATGTITGTFTTSIGTDLILVSATYDGSRAASGIKLYTNGLARTTVLGGASYTAMENTAALVHLGARYTTKAQFFDGNLGLALVAAKMLNPDEEWAIKTLVNAFFDLAL